jgi:hypothetical protein
MRWRSSAIDPLTRGAGPPYLHRLGRVHHTHCRASITNPRFFPLEKVQTGIVYLLETFKTSRNSSMLPGRTAALGIFRVPSASCSSYGSMYSVRSSPSSTWSSPTAALYSRTASSNVLCCRPGGSTGFRGTVMDSLNKPKWVDWYSLSRYAWDGIVISSLSSESFCEVLLSNYTLRVPAWACYASPGL